MNRAHKIFLCTLALAAPASADGLGRLFYTPEQRALLDQGQQPGKEQPDVADSLTVNGIVQKHGGPRTIWINGVRKITGPNDERSPESETVTLPGQKKKIRVKVGQKVYTNPAKPEQ